MNHQPFPHKVSIYLLIGIFLISAVLVPRLSTPAAAVAASSPGTPGADYPHLQVIQSTREGIVLEFRPPLPQISEQQLDGQLCQSLSIEGLSTLGDVGQLALPVQGLMLGIPPEARPELRVLSIESTLLDENIQLCPTPEPIFSREIEGTLTLTGYQFPQSTADEVNAFIPSVVAELVSSGYIRYQRYAQLRLNPLQYNPRTGELRHYSRIQVEVRFNSPESLARSAFGRILDPFFEDALAESLLNYDQAQAWRLSPQAVTDAGIESREAQPAFKIEVDQDGIYQLDYADLLTAGIPLADLDPRTFRLFNQDSEVAIQVEGEADGAFNPGDLLLFYGQKVDTKYTETNAYWLTWGDAYGLRIAALDGDPSGSIALVPAEFRRTLRVEENNLYVSDVPSGTDYDHWYWKFVDSYSGPVEISFFLPNLALDAHTASLCGLIKPYYSSPTPRIRIFLNQEITPIFDGNLSTDPAFSFSIDFDQSRLVEGTNTLRVETVNSSDTILINWFELTYYNQYIAQNDQLNFGVDTAGTWNVQVDGFSSPSVEVYDLSEPLTPVRIINSAIDVSSAGYRLSFVTTTAGDHPYLAQTTNQRLLPLSISAVERSNWKSSTNGAEYIIITHADFYDQAQALASFRESPDFRVQVIDVQELYDEFNGGVFSPEAIRDFLAHAFTHWQAPAPSFVLLLGDGHYDFKDFSNTQQPYFIPPYLVDVDPFMGETAADNRYVAVSGDDILPDMYIGRFPVRTVSEAQSMVDNVINYELTPAAQDWHAQLTFIADNPDSGGNFPAESDKIISYVPPEYTNQKIYYSVNYTDASAARAAVIAAVNQGRLILHYVGHGSIVRWASEGLLRLEDLVQFTNQDKLPLALPMTCLEGYFIRPTAQSLGESIVRMNDKGAIASYSPTGYGMAAGHALLDQSIFNHLFNHQNNQLGFLTTNAKYDLYAQSGAYRDLIDTYVLFGDPALRLQTLPVELQAPTGLSATPVSSTQINLSWTDNAADETAYHIERSLDGSTGWQEIATVGANITAYSNTSLTPGTTYYYRVRAFRSGDGLYSAYSNVANATTFGTLPAPSSLSATAVSTTQINLSWTDNTADETAFHIERSPTGTGGWTQVATVGANITAYSNTSLTPGTTYYYRVRAYRSGDGLYSAYSNVANATTFGTLPAPTGLSATAVSTTQINLSWTDNATDETAYHIERSPTGTGGWTQIDTVAANVTSYNNTGLTPGTTYYYRVRAYRSGDGLYSAYSNTANATTLKENAEVTLHDLSQVYDGRQKPVSATTVPTGLAVVITYNGELTPPIDAGEYAVIATIEDDQYQGSSEGTLVITPKPITVTADPKSKVYGASDPALTYQVEPSLISGDSFSGALSRAPGETVGSYAILQNTLSAGGNYTITYVGANLTITTRPIEVTADDKSKTFGGNDPALTYQVTDGSLAFDDQFTGGLQRELGEEIGTYDILQGTLALNANYALTFVPGNFTITSLPTVQVTVNVGQSKVYGENDPVFTYMSSDPAVLFSGALSRIAGENVGAYPITIGTLAAEGYQINLVTASFTIMPKPITVTADDKSKTVGDDDPPLTYQVTSGSLAFEDQFTGLLEREPGDDVGTYAILQGTLTLNANYHLSFVPGNFVINPGEGFTIFIPLFFR